MSFDVYWPVKTLTVCTAIEYNVTSSAFHQSIYNVTERIRTLSPVLFIMFSIDKTGLTFALWEHQYLQELLHFICGSDIVLAALEGVAFPVPFLKLNSFLRGMHCEQRLIELVNESKIPYLHFFLHFACPRNSAIVTSNFVFLISTLSKLVASIKKDNQIRN